MEALVSIWGAIPVWVYPVFLYGIFMGVKALAVRTVSLAMMMLLPLVFLGLSLSSLLPIVSGAPLVGLAWVLSLGLGGVLGWFYLTADPVSVDRPKGRLVVPGTPLVLVLFLTIFAVKFTFGYQSAMNPSVAAQPGFLLGVFGLSGVATGVVAGRTAKLYLLFIQTPRTA